jgi:hypothetical protein
LESQTFFLGPPHPIPLPQGEREFPDGNYLAFGDTKQPMDIFGQMRIIGIRFGGIYSPLASGLAFLISVFFFAFLFLNFLGVFGILPTAMNDCGVLYDDDRC